MRARRLLPLLVIALSALAGCDLVSDPDGPSPEDFEVHEDTSEVRASDDREASPTNAPHEVVDIAAPLSTTRGGVALSAIRSRSNHRVRLAFAGAYVAAAALAAVAIVQCSSVTELVVVVDTDLESGREVDEIVVTVDDGAGFSTERSARLDGASATTLPLTLGVTAGADPNAKVTVRALARLGGVDVSSASMRTTMVDGESKMAHVSICRSCATTTCAVADVEGSALPAWTGSPPSAPSCTNPVVADGGDASTLDASDASSIDASDAGDAADAGPPLLAWWEFDEDAGTVAYDRSGFGRELGFNGATITRGPGKFGRALVFTRPDSGQVNDVLDCSPHVASIVGTSGTLSFWWRDDDDAPINTLPSGVGIFAEQTSNRDHFYFERFKTRPPQEVFLGFQFQDAAAVDDYANDGGTTFTVVKGEWSRIVVTWTPNGATLRVGKGAAPMNLPFYRPWAPTNQNCFFGKHALGAIDDVRFYGRPLTDVEIADLP